MSRSPPTLPPAVDPDGDLSAKVAALLGIQAAPIDEDGVAHYLLVERDGRTAIDLTPIAEWTVDVLGDCLVLDVWVAEGAVSAGWYHRGEHRVTLCASSVVDVSLDHDDGQTELRFRLRGGAELRVEVRPGRKLTLVPSRGVSPSRAAGDP